MVLQNLFTPLGINSYRSFKCGAEVAVGAGLGLASIVGGLFSSKSASDNNAAMLRYNQWALKEQERYNKEMYEQQKVDQENYYNKYQSPQAIAQQLREAGINPAAAVGGLTGGTSSTPSMPSVGSVSPNAAPSFENTAQPLANSVESAARSVASLATAQSQLKQGEKAAAETKETLALLEGNVKSLMLQNAGQEAHNVYQTMINELTKKYGDNEHALGIRQSLANILLSSSQRDYNNALISCQEVQKKLLDNQLKMSDEDVANYSYLLSLMTNNVKKQGEVYDSQKAANFASANASNASAALSRSQTEFQNMANKVKSQEVTPAALVQYGKNYIKELKKANIISAREAAEELRHLDQIHRINSDNHTELFREVDAALKWFGEKVGELSPVKLK